MIKIKTDYESQVVKEGTYFYLTHTDYDGTKKLELNYKELLELRKEVLALLPVTTKDI